jgi:acetolactate synthase-1/2/3 large subunit
VNGAQALIRTLVDSGVDVCFTNPGTSEMHFVAALDDVPEMRAILGLFEGVVTGAADGYARIAGRPAGTLLHLGPGLGNGLANLHNARRARVPIINIVGDHATYHKKYDAPLESDIDALAGTVSGWVHRSTSADDVATDAARAVVAATEGPGRIATLILPADVCWTEAPGPVKPLEQLEPTSVSSSVVETVAEALRSGRQCTLFVGGRVLREPGLRAAHRIVTATGAKLLCETFPTRLERGEGVPPIDRLAYLAEFAQMQLEGTEHLLLVDTVAPVSFFAYPGKPSVPTPEGVVVHEICAGDVDPVAALEAIADAIGAPADGDIPVAAANRPPRPTGALTAESLANAIAAVLPERAILVDESNTSGLFIAGATAGCPRHDALFLTGGAIGIGLPLATGAAVAAPDRPVLCVEADGSAMYTLQALWTQQREQLDVTTVICNNGSYAVLNMELNRVGAETIGPKAKSMLDLHGPDLDFVAMAQGMGVPASRATTAEELTDQLEKAFATPGPVLVEAMVPPLAM